MCTTYIWTGTRARFCFFFKIHDSFPHKAICFVACFYYNIWMLFQSAAWNRFFKFFVLLTTNDSLSLSLFVLFFFFILFSSSCIQHKILNARFVLYITWSTKPALSKFQSKRFLVNKQLTLIHLANTCIAYARNWINRQSSEHFHVTLEKIAKSKKICFVDFVKTFSSFHMQKRKTIKVSQYKWNHGLERCRPYTSIVFFRVKSKISIWILIR